MLKLTLTVLRCPAAVAVPARRILDGGLVSIGRGNDRDWVLPDPDKTISRHHCDVVFGEESWHLVDQSENGTFVNDAFAPVGKGRRVRLSEGDRVRLGEYEIEIGFVEAARPSVGSYDEPPSFASPRVSPGWQDQSSPPANPWDDAGARYAGRPANPGPWDDDPPASPRTTQPAREPLSTGLHAGIPPTPVMAPAAAPVSKPPAGGDSGLGLAISLLLTAAKLPAGLAPATEGERQEMLKRAGVLLNIAIGGLRDLLNARSAFKGEFRIERTMLRQTDNDPLKFSSSAEHALMAMLDPRLPASGLMRETLEDLLLHQVALLQATQAAARALLDRLSPTLLEQEQVGGGMLPGSREKRLWEAYKRHHGTLVEQFEDDFDSAFGKAFARAYEQAAQDRGV